MVIKSDKLVQDKQWTCQWSINISETMAELLTIVSSMCLLEIARHSKQH